MKHISDFDRKCFDGAEKLLETSFHGKFWNVAISKQFWISHGSEILVTIQCHLPGVIFVLWLFGMQRASLILSPAVCLEPSYK